MLSILRGFERKQHNSRMHCPVMDVDLRWGTPPGMGRPLSATFIDNSRSVRLEPNLLYSTNSPWEEWHDFDSDAGPAFRASPVAQNARIHDHRGPHSGVGNWSERGRFHTGQCNPVEEPAGCQSGEPGETRRPEYVLRRLWIFRRRQLLHVLDSRL